MVARELLVILSLFSGILQGHSLAPKTTSVNIYIRKTVLFR